MWLVSFDCIWASKLQRHRRDWRKLVTLWHPECGAITWYNLPLSLSLFLVKISHLKPDWFLENHKWCKQSKMTKLLYYSNIGRDHDIDQYYKSVIKFTFGESCVRLTKHTLPVVGINNVQRFWYASVHVSISSRYKFVSVLNLQDRSVPTIHRRDF